MPRQSHSEARKHWPLLDLETGVVYEIDNSYPPTGRPPKPAYRIRRILDQRQSPIEGIPPRPAVYPSTYGWAENRLRRIHRYADRP